MMDLSLFLRRERADLTEEGVGRIGGRAQEAVRCAYGLI